MSMAGISEGYNNNCYYCLTGKKLCVCVLFFFLNIVMMWSNTSFDIQEQIEEHKNWVETHVPLPDTLSTDQLLIEVTKAISTSSLEKRYIDIIKYAGEKLDIIELIEYAQMRETRDIDKDDSHAFQCLNLLQERAIIIYGLENYITAYIRMHLVMMAREPEEKAELIVSFYSTASSLYKKDTSIQNEEIWLFAQLLSTLEPAMHGYEYPVIYENYRRLASDIINFYKRTHMMSEIRSYVYEQMGDYETSLQMYSDYYKFIKKKLDKEHNNVMKGLFPRSILTEDISDTIMAYENGYTLIDAACVIMSKVLHTSHPDVLNMELNQCRYSEPDTEGMNKVAQIRSYYQTYYGAFHPYTALATSVFRMQAVCLHKQNVDVGSYLSNLLTLRNIFSITSNAYLNAVNGEIATQLFCGNVQNALSLMKEQDGILDQKFGKESLKRLPFLTMKAYLQHGGMSGHEKDFNDLTDVFLNECENSTGFDAISVGKTLSNIAARLFSDHITALNIERAVLLKLKKEVGEEHPLFFFEYIAYGQLTAQAFPLEAITLKGESNPIALYEDIISKGKILGMEDAAYITAGQYMQQSGDYKKAQEYYSLALETIEKFPISEFPTSEEQMASRLGRAIIYSNMLQSCFNNLASEVDIDFYGDKLIQTFSDEFEFVPQDNAVVFKALITYLMWKNRLQETNEMIDKCLSYYEKNPNYVNDGNYLWFIHTKVQLFAHNNEMDKCLQWAEILEQKIEKLRGVSNSETYIGLQRIMYDMVEQKSPFDLALISKYLQPLKETINQYLALSNNNEFVLFNHGLYFLTKVARIVRDTPHFKKMATSAGLENEYDVGFGSLLNNYVQNEGIPLLLNLKKRFEELYPDNYQLSPTYHQIILNLAICTQRCTSDKQQAEGYYIQLSQYDKIGGNLRLGDYYMETGDVISAAQAFSHLEQSLQVMSDEQREHIFAGQRAEIYGRISRAYYQTGEYEKSLHAAQIYYEDIQERTKKNFDFYTQNERENFLNQYGSGGTPIIWLLPHMSDRLAAQAYNIILREKGFLLRASVRIHESILASGNDTLIRALDTLQFYQKQVQMMKNQDNQSEMISQIINLRDRYDKLERYITRASKPFRRKEDEIPNWEQVRDHLKEGEAAIEFVVTDSATLALVIAFGTNQPQCVSLLNIQEMESITQKILDCNMASLVQQLYEKDEEHLYEKIWKPLERYLVGVHTIFYSPTGFLNALAFHAIALPQGGFLIDKYDLHQLTTTGHLIHRDQPLTSASKPQTAKIYGSIFYNEEQKSSKPAMVNSIRNQWKSQHRYIVQQRGAIQDDDVYPFLPNTLLECDAITELLNECGFMAEEYIGSKPTEKEIRMMDGKSPDIFHVATHGFFYNEMKEAKTVPFFQQFSAIYPMFCTGLVLAGGEETWKGRKADLQDDNLLSSDEVSTLNLDNTRLVVLSACETGRGVFDSEGVWGLQRGFKQAGVQSICASLWSVDDLSTSQLMQSFYHLWLSKYKGKNMQKAMKEAMLEQRKQTPSPFYWAPFVLMDADD